MPHPPCDETCTTDCARCKGAGPSFIPERILRDAERLLPENPHGPTAADWLRDYAPADRSEPTTFEVDGRRRPRPSSGLPAGPRAIARQLERDATLERLQQVERRPLFPTAPGDMRADLENARARISRGDFDAWPGPEPVSRETLAQRVEAYAAAAVTHPRDWLHPMMRPVPGALDARDRAARAAYTAEQDASSPDARLADRYDVPLTARDQVVIGLGAAVLAGLVVRVLVRRWWRS